jgi:hypothetical protein
MGLACRAELPHLPVISSEKHKELEKPSIMRKNTYNYHSQELDLDMYSEDERSTR